MDLIIFTDKVCFRRVDNDIYPNDIIFITNKCQSNGGIHSAAGR
ncbi:hypothetical protein Bresa_00955|uniref:Uncharacterized protein n=1 Tax=Brenneria salicis ATCC 15712 = DSM 30166 TaxID=714314 RepID=A0A366HVZ5_9GAMM|nr:hypothetical protein [Brenneria salicis ATCC 15712 = DSM 30166]RBP57226.1 hypothetical protein DES54_1731 [Brenneria salicis ATCC 15712 = DSM 30166]